MDTATSSRFTFLLTLFLLLFVSIVIVLRSFLLRRRFRRRLQEAIAAGTLISSPGALGYGRLPEKPQLWDAYLAPAARAEWAHILPVAARIAAARKPESDDTAPPDPAPQTLVLRRVFTRSLQALSAAPTPRSRDPRGSSPAPPEKRAHTSDALAQAAEVEVSMLIAMPNRNRRHPHALEGADHAMSPKGKEKKPTACWDDGDDEEGVLDVAIGVAQVPFCDEGDDSDCQSCG